MSNKEEQLVLILKSFFEAEHWSIEATEDDILAVQGSGYGSGPSVINLTDLAKTITEGMDE